MSHNESGYPRTKSKKPQAGVRYFFENFPLIFPLPSQNQGDKEGPPNFLGV
jgi:hypothetical protein